MHAARDRRYSSEGRQIFSRSNQSVSNLLGGKVVVDFFYKKTFAIHCVFKKLFFFFSKLQKTFFFQLTAPARDPSPQQQPRGRQPRPHQPGHGDLQRLWPRGGADGRGRGLQHQRQEHCQVLGGGGKVGLTHKNKIKILLIWFFYFSGPTWARSGPACPTSRQRGRTARARWCSSSRNRLLVYFNYFHSILYGKSFSRSLFWKRKRLS